MTRIATTFIGSIGSDYMTLFIPDDWRKNGWRRAMISCHAAGGDGSGIFGINEKTFCERTGAPNPVTDLGGPMTWCNQDSIDAVTAAWDYVKTNLGARGDKLLLQGASMGGGTSLAWAVQNPTRVCGIVITIPVINIKDIRDNNRGGFTADVNAAYGGAAAFDAAEPTYNVINHLDVLAEHEIPIFINAGALDDICLIQWARQLRDTVPTCELFEYQLPHFPIINQDFYQRQIDYLTDPEPVFSAAEFARRRFGPLDAVARVAVAA